MLWPAFSLAKFIYSLPPPPERRTRNLEVICLGLPRSATESLHNALRTLGYENVSHGMNWWSTYPERSVLYYELALLRSQGRTPSPEVLRTKYFDRVLGDCDATTDIPPAWFAEELLAAYPDAKVVLNRRRDVKAWKTSFRESVLPFMQSWSHWFAGWFEAEIFWTVALTNELHGQYLFRGDFEANAERAYTDHYGKLERILQDGNRPYLDWSVEEGWEPLCKFLDKPVPDQSFPRGNVAAEFAPKVMKSSGLRFQRARRNGAILSCLVVTCVALVVGIWQ